MKLFGKKEEKTPWDGEGVGVWYDLKRWIYTRFLGYIIVRYYDQIPETDADGNVLSRQDRPYDAEIYHALIKKRYKPPTAMRCLGEPYVYAVDRAEIRYPRQLKAEKWTAHMGWLYMEYGGFDKCLAKDWSDFDHLDLKKILLIGGIVVAVAVVMLVMRH